MVTLHAGLRWAVVAAIAAYIVMLTVCEKHDPREPFVWFVTYLTTFAALAFESYIN